MPKMMVPVSVPSSQGFPHMSEFNATKILAYPKTHEELEALEEEEGKEEKKVVEPVVVRGPPPVLTFTVPM